jgi:hypothetical protein
MGEGPRFVFPVVYLVALTRCPGHPVIADLFP